MAAPAGHPAGEQPRRSLADKINLLFAAVLRPDNKPYSNEEVARALPDQISGSYLWLLRSGKRDNPTMRHLEALAQFFDVSPAYFFDEASSSKIADELTLLRDLADSGVTKVAARLGGLSSGSLTDILNIVERIRASEGLDTAGVPVKPSNSEPNFTE